MVAAGSTGEAPLLADEEVRQIVQWLRDVVPDDRLLWAGAGRESTRATVRVAEMASEAGADAVLVRPPAYYGPAMTPEALTTHYRAVADRSPLPVYLYNIPKYTHLQLSDGLMAVLAEHPNIHGAKDSSGDLKNFAAYREAAPAWELYMGSGALFYAALELGAAGAVAAVGCFAARSLAEIGAAFRRADRAGAGAIQERMAPLHREIVSRRGVAGVKAAMDLVGLAGGPVRPPLRDLAASEREAVGRLLGDAGVQPD